jgi:hypothetical protein
MQRSPHEPVVRRRGNPHAGEPEGINTTHYLAGGAVFGPGGRRPCQGAPERPSLDNDLLQVMPWPVYRHLTDRDLQGIYEYLSAIPHAEPAPPPAPASAF